MIYHDEDGMEFFLPERGDIIPTEKGDIEVVSFLSLGTHGVVSYRFPKECPTLYRHNVHDFDVIIGEAMGEDDSYQTVIDNQGGTTLKRLPGCYLAVCEIDWDMDLLDEEEDYDNM